MKRFFLILLIVLLGLVSKAQTHPQVYCPAPDSARLDSMLELLEGADLSQLRIGEAAVAVGKMLKGEAYVEKTLEIAGEERLVINLYGLDCTTFLETAATFARIIKLEHYNQMAYWRELGGFRYVENWPAGYTSRLHYFSDWIATNSEKKLVCDITTMLGGVPYPNKIDFMSQHTKSYPALADSSLIPAIIAREAITSARTYHFIPKDSILKAETHMRDGDIIAITTGVGGLDVIHTGLAIRKDDRIHLLHASSNSGKVEITKVPLSAYMKGKKSQTGIMVARLVEP